MQRDLAAQAQALRALHHADAPLVLPNAWDAASARAVEAAGFPVVATTSGGVARSLGFEDHQGAPAEEMLAAAARITAAVGVPVTADAEAGYGLPAEVLVERLLAAGVVGCNLEDTDHASGSLGSADAQARYLEAVRAVARSAGVELVVNARIDVFLHGDAGPEERVEEALRRGRLYAEAGADCLYPILARGRATLRALALGLECPMNAMATPGGLSVSELAELGVRRISFGSGLFVASLAGFEASLAEIRGS